MQKIYLLLRNNQQSGPFSIDELLQHSLKNDDLIWVEDQSAGWSYPSEVESLMPFMQPSLVSEIKGFKKVEDNNNQKSTSSNQKDIHKNKSSKHIFIRLPEGRNNKKVAAEKPVADLEQKAAALREKVLSAAAGNSKDVAIDDVQTNYARTLSDVEQEYTSWVYKKKVSNKQHAAKKQLAYIVVAVVGLLVTFFVAKSFIINEGEEATLEEQKDLENTTLVSSENEDSLYNYANVSTVENNAEVSIKDGQSATLKTTGNANVKDVTTPKDAAKQEQLTIEKKVMDNNAVQVSNNVPATDAAGKKKTIGQAIEGIIGKIKSGKDKEANSNETEEKEAEATAKAAVKDLSKNVVLSSNQTAANSWMLGIKGLKVTLQNKGTEPIKAASVAVRYYNEEKELMDTKVIHFANVKSGKKAVITAPDHRLASFTDYLLISASN